MSINTRLAICSIVSFILGGVVVATLGSRHLKQEKQKLYAGAVKIQVIVAKTDLSAGTILERDHLAIKQVYKAAVGDNVFPPEQVDFLKGLKLKYSVKRAEPIFSTFVGTKESEPVN